MIHKAYDPLHLMKIQSFIKTALHKSPITSSITFVWIKSHIVMIHSGKAIKNGSNENSLRNFDYFNKRKSKIYLELDLFI